MVSRQSRLVGTLALQEMKIVIVGSGGRLGAALARSWSGDGDTIVGFTHASLNLADDSEVRGKLEPLDFDVLVNCAALTNVDYCETHELEAMRVNADAVRTIARICAAKGRRCLHISTDYVFDGEKREPYTELDLTGPLGAYGRSKLVGERAVLKASDRHLVVRVSWVFGPDRPSFVDQILQKARETDNLAAVADKWAVPTYTLDAARLLRPLLSDVPVGGILHLCNAGSCTWQEYGQYAIDCAASFGIPLKGDTLAPQKMAELKAFIARRPVYTVMSTERLTELTSLVPRTWQEAVEDHVMELALRK
jgi:dTDP-4-dehydrorhamnose reductase